MAKQKKFNPEDSGIISITDHDKIYDYHITPDGSIFVNKKGSTQYSSIDALPPEKQAEARKKLVDYSNTFPDGGGQEISDRLIGKGRTDAPISPLPLRTVGSIPNTSSPINMPTPPSTTPTYDDSSLGMGKSGDIFDALKSDIELQALQNEQNYAKDQQNIKDVYNRKDRLAAGSLLTGLVTNGLQDTTYEPKTKTNTFVQSEFRGIPNSIIESQAAKLRENTAGLGRELLAGGARPSEVASILAGAQGKTIDAESNLRFNFFTNQYNKDAAKYKELRNIADYNKKAVITAKESQRDDQNQLTNAIGDNFQSFLNNKDANVTGQFEANNAATAAYNRNKSAITQNDINIAGSASALQATQEYNNKYFQYLQDYLNKKRQTK